jgi:hypothetical protein
MLRMKSGLVVMVSALLYFVLPAGAAIQSTAEYSADSYMETAGEVTNGTIYVVPGRERREFVMGGEKSITIMRHDKKVTWTLMPADKMYTETKLGKSGGKDDLSAYKIDQTTIGPDTINGIKTTKSKIVMIGPDGSKLGGFWWVTKEGIVVKMDAMSVDKNSKARFKTELKNLKIGKQDPSLFEIPAGYSNMTSMGGIGNMMMGDDKDDDSKPEPKEKEKGGFGLKDAFDLLK